MPTNTAASVLRRAILYVPASSQRKLIKSLTLTSDNVTYDLEDSVTPQEKHNARAALVNHFQTLSTRPETIVELAARINAVSTPHALADLEALGTVPNLDTIIVPKVNSAADLTFVADVLRHVASSRCSSSSSSGCCCQQSPIKLLALIESATAILNLRQICEATPHLAGLIFAAEDFALDLSLTRSPSLREFLYARSAIATHARAFNLHSTIDLVCTQYRGDAGRLRLLEECADGRGMGFNGKQCIHPDQVDVVQRAFSPGEEEVEWSVRVVVADEKAAKSQGRGAWTLDGKMIDAPIVGKAKAIVRRAKRCGYDVDGLRDKWKDQEPA